MELSRIGQSRRERRLTVYMCVCMCVCLLCETTERRWRDDTMKIYIHALRLCLNKNPIGGRRSLP